MNTDRIECFLGGAHLFVEPSELRIEIDKPSAYWPHIKWDSLTVKLEDMRFFAGMGLPEDVHGEYSEWAEDEGCRFATPADKKAFQAAIESAVERHCARAQHPAAT